MSHADTEARHVVDMVHGLLDEAHAAEGPLVERVRGVLARVTVAEQRAAEISSERDRVYRERDTALGERNAYRCQVNALLTTDAAMVSELIDVLGNGCLPSDIVHRVRALKEDRERARDDAREARAIVTRVRLLLKDLLAAGGEP